MTHLLGISSCSLAIHVRMSENQFVAQTVAHVGYIEIACLTAHLGIKHHVQQHVTQLLADLIHIMFGYGRRKFECLFYRILTQAVKSLFSIPRTPLPEFVHDCQQPIEGR